MPKIVRVMCLFTTGYLAAVVLVTVLFMTLTGCSENAEARGRVRLSLDGFLQMCRAGGHSATATLQDNTFTAVCTPALKEQP